MIRYIIGVDEAGRGPLAGPVSVGVVAVPVKFNVLKEFPGVRDSKKLSPERREELYEKLAERARQGDVRFCVRFSSHSYIDEFGITRALRRALWSGVRALAPNPLRVQVLLDGLLYAPPKYKQKTIIRGDDLIPVISLASIAAKVERDRRMRRLAKQFPEYGFERHKGYGTKAHRRAIAENGLCEIHRATFCQKIITGL